MMRALLLLCLVAALSSAASFKVETVDLKASNCVSDCALSIVTAGTPGTADGRTAEQILGSAASWQVRAFRKKGEEMIPIAITGAKAIPTGIGASLAVELSFARSQLGGEDPRSLKWSVLYLGSGDFQIAQGPSKTPASLPGLPQPAKEVFGEAESRDKADLYLSGNVLAGVGTKPIYTLDAKVNIAPPLHWHGVRAGVYGEIQSNANSEPPNDKSEVDPDSIRAYATVNGLFGKSLYWDIRPAGGEFSRKYPASSFVSAANFAWWFDPTPVKGGWLTFYPSLGTELGMNLNKPATLFSQPSQLARFDAIRRLVPGMNATYRLWGKKDSPALTFTGTYQARVLFADEPFTTLEYYTTTTGTRQREKVARLRGNTRHWVEGTATWNINEYFGVMAQYKYGSLPPLFQLIQQQVTFGLVFKSTLWPR
jgi:hypothetical protein